MNTDQIIDHLTTGLAPAHALRPPAVRALLWLVVVGAVSAALILRFTHWGVILPRLQSPRVALETTATALTAVTATIAAFELSIPDRSPRWIWLPVPTLLLWLAASGAGCLSNGLGVQHADGPMGESAHCFVFITGASVPLAIGLFWMLRRARPLDALPVAAVGTLGIAATAAFVLQFFHPFDVTVIDLALHLAAIGLVVLVGTTLRRPLLDASGGRQT